MSKEKIFQNETTVQNIWPLGFASELQVQAGLRLALPLPCPARTSEKDWKMFHDPEWKCGQPRSPGPEILVVLVSSAAAKGRPENDMRRHFRCRLFGSVAFPRQTQGGPEFR